VQADSHLTGTQCRETNQGFAGSLAGSQEENTLLGKRIKKLDADLAFIATQVRPLNYGHNQSKVLVSDPKWHFIVINAGEIRASLSTANCSSIVMASSLQKSSSAAFRKIVVSQML